MHLGKAQHLLVPHPSEIVLSLSTAFHPFSAWTLGLGKRGGDFSQSRKSECSLEKPGNHVFNQKTEIIPWLAAVQFSSVAQSCLTLCGPMNRSTPGLPVHHKLPEFTQTHAHRVGDAIQPSHPLSSPSPPAPNPSQHQGLFQ